jgi:hypothetical protein
MDHHRLLASKKRREPMPLAAAEGDCAPLAAPQPLGLHAHSWHLAALPRCLRLHSRPAPEGLVQRLVQLALLTRRFRHRQLRRRWLHGGRRLAYGDHYADRCCCARIRDSTALTTGLVAARPVLQIIVSLPQMCRADYKVALDAW